GRHYEGAAALTEFLRANGFDRADAQIKTERLHVVANRAVWTYSCSCAPGSTEVRLVTNHNKISVFAVMPPASGPIRTANVVPVSWLLAAGTISIGVLAGAIATWRLRHRLFQPTG